MDNVTLYMGTFSGNQYLKNSFVCFTYYVTLTRTKTLQECKTALTSQFGQGHGVLVWCICTFTCMLYCICTSVLYLYLYLYVCLLFVLDGCLCICTCMLSLCGLYSQENCVLLLFTWIGLPRRQLPVANPQNGDNKDHHHYQPLHHHHHHHHQITQNNIAWVSLKGLFIQTFHFKKHPD